MGVNGRPFSGSPKDEDSWRGLQGLVPTGDITWSSDSELVARGWKLCHADVPPTPAPTAAPTPVPTPPPTVAPAFIVTEGSCRVMEDGCVVSPNYPSLYENDDRCTIATSQREPFSLDFDADAFYTELGHDVLIVNGRS